MPLADIGTTLLLAALLISSAQATCLCLRRRNTLYTALLPALALTGWLCLSLAFIVLIYGFIVSDFSLSLVYEHSHTLKPMLYKISGAWGNHEGSMLLWCWVLGSYSAALTLRGRALSLYLRAGALHVMGALQVAFIAYMMLTSSPFVLLMPAPPEGLGLNPLLQDVGLALHPPLLYGGYVGFAAVFALAFTALWHGQVGRELATALHPWIMLPWAFLTLGIGLGSWWAYRELGWGGWWFWDPVENASLLPWLAGTALFHSNLSLRTTGSGARWVLTLSLCAFSLSLLGTFLVRSGLLTSVHSFASDPTRGLAIAGIAVAIMGAALVVYLRGAARIPAAQAVAGTSRAMAVMVNNLLLCLMACTILLAMIYPLVLEALGGRMLSISTEFYNRVFTALSIPLLGVCGLSLSLHWSASLRRDALRIPAMLGIVSLGMGALIGYGWWEADMLMAGALGAGIWLVLATFYHSIRMIRRHTPLLKLAGVALGHGGLGIFVIAATAYGALHKQYEFGMATGESVAVGTTHHLHLESLSHRAAHNYLERRGVLTLEAVQSGTPPLTLTPSERYYPVEEEFTAEAYIRTALWGDTYATLRRMPELPALQADVSRNVSQPDDVSRETSPRVAVMLHRNPGMVWIWASCMMLACSGVAAVLWYARNIRRKGTTDSL